MSGWPTARLEDCAEIVAGATPSTSAPVYWGGDICWATPKDLSELEGAYISDTPRKITRSGLQSCAATVLPPDSVLFSSRAPIGHVAINTVPMATNQGFKSLVPNRDRVHAKFLYHWIRRNRSYLESLGNGATFKEVSKAVVSRIEIPVPPLPEQRRLAAILDKADALRAKRRAALAQLDTLTQSIFLDMFGDPATNPKGWRDAMLLGEAADIVSGVTIGRRLDGKTTRSVPYLAVVNVQERRLDLSIAKTTEATDEEIRRYRLERDDLLLTEGGDPDKLGRGTLWADELPECIHQNHVFRVRLNSKELTPLFLSWLIGSERGKRYFLRSAKQTTGIASINMTQLRAFPLLVPPLPLQRLFAERVSASERLKAHQLAGACELDLLFASLQDRAFRGEL
jgi:type I restriction enzyme, S subunit